MTEADANNQCSVEEEYQRRMSELTPAQRVSRSIAMFNWTREMIGRQVVAELGEMSYDRLRWEVALRMYAADPKVCEMIRKKLGDVSG